MTRNCQRSKTNQKNSMVHVLIPIRRWTLAQTRPTLIYHNTMETLKKNSRIETIHNQEQLSLSLTFITKLQETELNSSKNKLKVVVVHGYSSNFKKESTNEVCKSMAMLKFLIWMKFSNNKKNMINNRSRIVFKQFKNELMVERLFVKAN